MAKPMPTEPPDGDTIAVLIAITWPSMLKIGPPELPGLIGASSCRKLSNGPAPRSRPRGRNDARRNRAAETEWVSRREHPIADLHLT